VRPANRVFRPLARRLLDLEVTGTMPAGGPVVVAANHLSHLDPIVVTSAADRPIRFLAVDELFGRSRLFDATVIGFFAAIPLDRDGIPVQALRAAIDELDAGGAVGVFPEGRRVDRWGDATPKRGAAWLAWASGALLVPVAVAGSETILAPSHRGLGRASVRVWIEPPLDWTGYVDRVDPLGAMMEDWRSAIDRRLRLVPSE